EPVLSVAETVAAEMDSHRIIVGKSTFPVGTCEKLRSRVQEVLVGRGRGDVTFDVVSNPEFLREGSAVADCTHPERIIIGTDSDEVERVMRELYAPFIRSNDDFLVMDMRSAELTKYAANCM